MSESSSRRVGRAVLSALAPFIGLLIVVGIFWLYGRAYKPNSEFLSSYRMALIAKQTAIVGMGALGMTVVIISAGIDLSVGSLLALASVVLASVLNAAPGPVVFGMDLTPIVALLATLVAGILAGVLNGLLITWLRLVPFIVTLGTMLLFRGLSEELADQKKIAAEAPAWLSTLLDPPTPGSAQIVCTGVWLVVVLGILLALVLRRTTFGRYVFAIGSNENTARLCGIAVNRTKIVVYALAGFFMALAGLLAFNDLNRQGDPSMGVGLELEVIAAVVIGGGSLNGGRGSVLGSMIGALMMTTLRSGCVFAEVPDPVQKIVIGAIIIGAVAVDHLRQRRGSS